MSKYPDDCPTCNNRSQNGAPPSCCAITLATNFCYGDCEGCDATHCIANENFIGCDEYEKDHKTQQR